MPSTQHALRALGHLIRARRVTAGLTQSALGRKAGIVGKYVSEIERGNRDVPFSTLRAIVEDGLGLALDVRFEAKGSARSAPMPPIPAELREIAELPPESRKAVLAIVRALLGLVR